MHLEQLRKQAKELTRAARAGEPEALARLRELPTRLASAQLVLAREHGYSSWPALVHALAEQPFHTDLDYYEGRAYGIASVRGVPLDEARRDLAGRHGLDSWAALVHRVEALASGEEPLPPFMLAYRALEAGDCDRLVELLDRHPELVSQRGTNGNDLLGMAGDLELTRLLLDRGADVNRGNDYGWTKLHQAGYGNDVELARLLLAAGARTDLSARGDGGTPLVQALVWAAKADRVEAIDRLVELGARIEADPYRGTPLAWAAVNGRLASVRRLLDLGADPNGRASFGGPDHGEGVTPIHLAAQAGQAEAVDVLLAAGADPALKDSLHCGTAAGWAHAGCHYQLEARLRELIG